MCAAQAHVHPYFPYFHVDATADVLLFKPTAGASLGTPAFAIIMIVSSSSGSRRRNPNNNNTFYYYGTVLLLL